ncbi:molybdopterin-guanine dinucleotide biosynthesis protein B [Laribacter hongkongensis]|nr:molybdopterin-guanine dinucleotide biosynthesis protein B [Laribacter hongkongensis]
MVQTTGKQHGIHLAGGKRTRQAARQRIEPNGIDPLTQPASCRIRRLPPGRVLAENRQGFCKELNVNVIGFAGYSGSGKTTLLERVVSRLTARGIRVAVVKHTHHDADFDTPGRDSWRHREAGAAAVMLVTPRQRMLIEQVPEANDAPLSGHLARLAPCDLVIVEGFKHEAIDKIEVVNSALGRPRLAPDDARVVAVVADQPAGLADALPRFHRDDVDGVVAFLCERYLS